MDLPVSDGAELLLQSQDERPLDRYVPELARALRAALPERIVLDGEVVVARAGRLDFDALSQRLHPAASRVERLSHETPASIVFFDILCEGTRDLRPAPFAERRRKLEAIVGPLGAPIRLTPATTERAVALDWFARFEGAGPRGVHLRGARGRGALRARRALRRVHLRSEPDGLATRSPSRRADAGRGRDATREHPCHAGTAPRAPHERQPVRQLARQLPPP